jgi:hypothetical protein
VIKMKKKKKKKKNAATAVLLHTKNFFVNSVIHVINLLEVKIGVQLHHGYNCLIPMTILFVERPCYLAL